LKWVRSCLAWHGKVDVVYLSMWRFVLGHSGGVSSCDWRLEAVSF
jgi:hypothetical protein